MRQNWTIRGVTMNACEHGLLTVLNGFLMLRFFNKKELLLRMMSQLKSADIFIWKKKERILAFNAT